MTVAVGILGPRSAALLASASGLPAVRRIADAAWAGGAIPILVPVGDGTGVIAAALAGSEASVVTAGRTLGSLERAARKTVRGTSALILWPAAFPWIDAETVTMLIQAHGRDPRAIHRPSWEEAPGWPVLVPVGMPELAALPLDPERLLAALADHPVRLHPLGDPGVLHGPGRGPETLPTYRGPERPLEDPPEWGSLAGEHSATDR